MVTAEEVVHAEIAAWLHNGADEVMSHFAQDATFDFGSSAKSRISPSTAVVETYMHQTLTNAFVLPVQFNSPAAPMEFR